MRVLPALVGGIVAGLGGAVWALHEAGPMPRRPREYRDLWWEDVFTRLLWVGGAAIGFAPVGILIGLLVMWLALEA